MSGDVKLYQFETLVYCKLCGNKSIVNVTLNAFQMQSLKKHIKQGFMHEHKVNISHECSHNHPTKIIAYFSPPWVGRDCAPHRFVWRN